MCHDFLFEEFQDLERPIRAYTKCRFPDFYHCVHDVGNLQDKHAHTKHHDHRSKLPSCVTRDDTALHSCVNRQSLLDIQHGTHKSMRMYQTPSQEQGVKAIVQTSSTLSVMCGGFVKRTIPSALLSKPSTTAALHTTMLPKTGTRTVSFRWPSSTCSTLLMWPRSMVRCDLNFGHQEWRCLGRPARTCSQSVQCLFRASWQ